MIYSRIVLPVILILVASRFLFAQVLRGDFPTGGGPVTIRASEPFVMESLELTSLTASLLPVSNGDASPFQFLVTNSESIVTYGSIGEVVVLEEAASLTLTVEARGGGDVHGLAGFSGGIPPTAFEVCERNVTCSVPEPSCSIPFGLACVLTSVCGMRTAKKASRGVKRGRQSKPHGFCG